MLRNYRAKEKSCTCAKIQIKYLEVVNHLVVNLVKRMALLSLGMMKIIEVI